MDLFTLHAKVRAIALANLLLDEEGDLQNLDRVKLEYIFIPQGYSDGDITEHFQRVLTSLQTDPELSMLLQSFTFPVFDPKIEEMIATLLDAKEKLTRRHLIWAVLSALLCPLRQRVGSCFATAPAILIHEEQPIQFLKDLRDLLATGKLTRTFGGVEYSVPMSPSSGPEDFQSEHTLLKTWEYTLASFVDVKTEFSKWNLYVSLGLHPDEKEGVGELIYTQLEKQLNEANEELQKQQIEYEIAYDQVRATEVLLRNAATEAEGRRLRSELQARAYHFQSCEEIRNRWNEKAQNIAHLFSFLIEQIVEKFQEHFQEVYDAGMYEEVQPTPYDDAPAGFRLLYKHGRTHVGSWTFIYNSAEYLQALKDFFLAIEHPVREDCEWEEGKDEISKLITAIIHHIGTEEFLLSAFHRMAKAHRVPLQKVPLEQMEKKPWAYTSGGTMPTLLKTYFRREGSLSEEARWVDSPQDLLIFLLDTIKILPPNITDLYQKDPQKRMLMTSPTHAFSLLPGQEFFRKGWEDRGFTYTWVRDQIIQPCTNFYEAIRLEPHEQQLLLQKLNLSINHYGTLSVADFYSKLPSHPKIDAFLYESLPLITPPQAEALFRDLGLKEIAPFKPIFRRELHDLILSHYTSSSKDLHLEVARLMEKKKLAPPRPLLIADTNWSKFYFSFLVNPGTGELEFWRTDKIGLTGTPMREWEHFLNGTVKEPWGIYLRPYEYTA